MVVSLRELLDPDAVSDGHALEIARQRARERESFGTELARCVAEYLNKTNVEAATVERGFRLVEAAAQPAKYFRLVRAGLVHDYAFVRATAIALLSRQAANNTGWIVTLSVDPDVRVRAGTMEALWGQTGSEAERALMSAAQDTSEVVAANAVYGLYLFDAERHLAAVQKFAAHRNPAFRCAAAVLIARLGPAVRGQLLKPLLTDEDASVRRAAFRTLTAIKHVAQTVTTSLASPVAA